MKGIINWNGINSDDFGIFVEACPDRKKPVRKMETYSVPGRSGDIIQVQDAWENVTQEYTIFSDRDNLDGVFEWLYGGKGYCELSDDFDSLHYRLAYFAGPVDLENVMEKVGRAKIQFNCKPQVFLAAGKQGIPLNAPNTVVNPTGFVSRPTIQVFGSGDGTLTVGGTIVSIANQSGTLILDCDEKEAYDQNGANKNGSISTNTGDFPKLVPGPNAISFGGGVTMVNIIPRWYTI